MILVQLNLDNFFEVDNVVQQVIKLRKPLKKLSQKLSNFTCSNNTARKKYMMYCCMLMT